MRHQPLACLSVVLLLALWTSDAYAQGALSPQSWYVAPVAGVSLDPDGRAAATFGGAVGYALTQEWMLEGELGHVADRVPGDDDVNSRLTTAAVAVLYHFGEGRLIPYVSGGAGIGRYTFETSVPSAEVDAVAFAATLGAGAAYSVSPRAQVRGDFRYFNFMHGTSSDETQLVIVEDVPSAWRFVGAFVLRLGR